MHTRLIDPQKLEALFLANWANLIDKTQFLKRVLADARDYKAPVVSQEDAPPGSTTKMTITKFEPLGKGQYEIWVEFTLPRESGVLVGTHIYQLSLDGEATLVNTSGVCFESKVRQPQPV
jgi:hypothetical protein